MDEPSMRLARLIPGIATSVTCLTDSEMHGGNCQILNTYMSDSLVAIA